MKAGPKIAETLPSKSTPSLSPRSKKTMSSPTTEIRPSLIPIPVQRKCACGTPGCADCGTAKEEKVQRKASGNAPSAVPASVLRTVQSPGRPLDTSTRRFMESRFGHSFGDVRIHTGPQASRSASDINARAYTIGRNIAFGEGEYRPGTTAGRHLLAHELAHTVQQRGVQRMPAGLDKGASDPLEREADSAAAAAMSGSPVTLTGSSGPIVSRVARTWLPNTLAVGTKNLLWTAPVSAPGGDEIAVNIGPFPVPEQKGHGSRVLAAYRSYDAQQALEAKFDGTVLTKDGSPTSLKEKRDKTADLKASWFSYIGLTEAAAVSKWNQGLGHCYGTAGTFAAPFYPKVQDGASPGSWISCHMDHIVELQLGGTNDKENIQILDGSQNTSSGSQIAGYLEPLVKDIGAAIKAQPAPPPYRYLVLHFDGVTTTPPVGGVPAPDKLRSGYAVGLWVENPSTLDPATTTAPAVATETIDLLFGAKTATITAPQGTKSGTFKEPIKIDGDAVNQGAAFLIPGLILREFLPGKSRKINATFDQSTPGSAITMAIPDGKTISLSVDSYGKITAANLATMKVDVKGLSPGVIKSSSMTADGVSGVVRVTPTIRLIKEVDLAFKPNEMKLIAPLDTKKIDPGIPGFSITAAAVEVALLPELSASGKISFAAGPAKTPILDGSITAKATPADGFIFTGLAKAHVPGLDAAEGQISYQKLPTGDYGWSGFVELKTSQIPGAKAVQARADIGMAGLVLSGGLTLGFPGSKTGEIGLGFTWDQAKQAVSLEGSAFYEPPIDGVEPVDLHLYYDFKSSKLRGDAKTGFAFRDFTGTFKIEYEDGFVWGTGSLSFKKGKADGKLTIKVDREHKFSGSGTLNYQLTPNVLVTGSIILDKNQEVVLSGELTYSKPIPFFEPIKGDYSLLKVSQNIPIPGLALSPGVGVELKLTAALSAGYSLGPAGIKNIKVRGTFKPFDPNPDLGISAHADFYCTANAYISGTLGGGVALSVFVAEVSGNLGVNATANLSADINAPVDLKYAKDTFSADIGVDAKLQLAIIMKLLAWVTAGVGFGPFKTESTWEWTLASYTYKPAFAQLGLKLKKPFHYDSHGGFSIPSASDIEIAAPTLDAKDIISSLFRNAATKAPPPPA